MTAPLVLQTFGPMFGVPDASPFVVKAIVLLKMSGLPFVESPGSDPRKAPKKKMPVRCDPNGPAGEAVVPDSTFIRWHLETTYGIDFDAGLSSTQRATAWMIERALEEHLYFALLHERWLDDDNFQRGPRRFFDGLPTPLQAVVAGLVRRGIRNGLQGQGLGRHSDAERLRLAAGTIDAAATLLGDTPYLFGDEPHGADATLFGFTVNLLRSGLQPKLAELTAQHANLRDFTERMDARYFPPR